MANITELPDVQAAFRRPIPDSDHAWVEDQIAEAELILGTYRGDLAAWINNDDTREARVKRVVVRMVVRVLRNPDGFLSESDGDYSYSRDKGIASGAIYASPADLRLLGMGNRRAGTIRTSLPADSPRNIRERHPADYRLGAFE